MSERLQHDPTRETILELIEAEQDGTKRAHLMIMLRILDSLEKVSITALKIETELSVHKLEFDEYKSKFNTFEKDGNAIINKGKGAVWTAIALIGILEGMVLYQFNNLTSSIRELTALSAANSTSIAVLKSAQQYDGNIRPKLENLNRD